MARFRGVVSRLSEINAYLSLGFRRSGVFRPLDPKASIWPI